MSNMYVAPINFNPTDFKAALVALFEGYTEPENSRLSEWSDDEKAQEAFKSLKPGQGLQIGGQTYEVQFRNSILNLSPITEFAQFVLA